MKPVRVRISSPAARDLDAIAVHIAQDDPAAALRVLDRIDAALRRLATHPRSGHARRDLSLPTSVRIVTVAPYLIVYTVARSRVVVLRVLHAARDVGRSFESTSEE